jgi:hypothetical protein
MLFCFHFFVYRFASRTHYLDSQCGPMPFARVAQHQVLQSNLVIRGNGSDAPVHQLTLDTDFAAASPSQCVLSLLSNLNLHKSIFYNRGGDVNFSVQGQNGRDNSNAVNRRSHRRLRSLARSQNHVYRQVDGNSTGGNSTVDGNSTVSGAAQG